MSNPLTVMQSGLPVTPQILENAMPVSVPKMEWESNFVEDWVHNWKLGRLQKAAERRAAIQSANTSSVQTSLESIKSVVTFSSELKAHFEEIEHRKAMWKAEQQSAELKNVILQAEAESAKLDVMMKHKEAERILGE